MNDFIAIYRADIIYGTAIIVIVGILYLINRIIHKFLTRTLHERLPGASTRPINFIRDILTVLWIILGGIAFSFMFIQVDKEVILKGYFKLFSYLGLVTVITIILVMVSNLWFKYKIKEKIEKQDDTTSYKFLHYIVLFIVVLIGVVFISLAFPSLKGLVNTALGGAGILALIVGFAAQETLANITAGLFLISFKPFKIGDRVMLSDTMVGTVTDITLRHTIIRNFNNKMIVIPNAIINKEKIINYDLGEHKLCEYINIEISYDSDIDLAKKIMQQECENHHFILDNRSDIEINEGQPIVKTALTELGTYSISLRAWAWVRNHPHSFVLKCDVLESIKKRFDKENIEIPYPYRNIVIKDSLVK